MNRLKRTLGYAALGFVIVFVFTWVLSQDVNDSTIFAFGLCGIVQGWQILGSKMLIGGIVGFGIRVITSVLIGWIVVPIELIRSFVEIYQEKNNQKR